MPYAVMTSGGKDSTLALDRAQRQGLDVRFLVNIYEGSTNRVRFHGIRHDLIELQARALELELISAHTHPQAFEPVFRDVLGTLKRRGITGIVFGNIHLADVRAWYEERTRAAGLDHVEPLWGFPPIELAWEFVELGYHAVVVSVDLRQRAAGFLGREFDADLVTDLGVTDDLDPCGERGEYHTFAYDGPAFANPVPYRTGKIVEIEGHRFIDLVTDSIPSGDPKGRT